MDDINKAIIYLWENQWYIIEKVIKMGVSSSGKDRKNGYLTGEVFRGRYIYMLLKYH